MNLFWLICAVFVSLRFIFLGDMSFLGDEAMLLENALKLNSLNQWASTGLVGSKGTFYGPLATWIYQLLFKITHNLNSIIVLKIIFESALQIWGVYELRKHFKIWPNFVFLLIFMSPYFWFYSRMFWDNPFNISFSLLLFTGTLNFIKKPSSLGLIRISIFAAFCLSIHLMSLSFLATICIFIMINCYSYLRKNITSLLLSVFSFIIILFPYLINLINKPKIDSIPNWELNFKFLEGTLLGSRLLTNLGINYLYGNNYSIFELSFVHFSMLLGVVLLIYFSWAFFVIVLGPKTNNLHADRLNRTISGINLVHFLKIFFAIHLVFCFYTRLSHHPHYFNGAWIPFWILTAFGLSNGIQSKCVKTFNNFKKFTNIYTVASILSILNLLYLAHKYHGIRSVHYGPSINQQSRLVNELKRNKISFNNISFETAWLKKEYEKSVKFLYFHNSSNVKESSNKVVIGFEEPNNHKNPRLIIKH